jgi:hypothetical protein
MARRALGVGDVVSFRESAVTQTGSTFSQPHYDYTIVDQTVEHDGRRLFELTTPSRDYPTHAWPSEVRLATGATERAYRHTVARVATMVAAKAEREAKRRRPAPRKKRNA